MRRLFEVNSEPHTGARPSYEVQPLVKREKNEIRGKRGFCVMLLLSGGHALL